MLILRYCEVLLSGPCLSFMTFLDAFLFGPATGDKIQHAVCTEAWLGFWLLAVNQYRALSGLCQMCLYILQGL